MEAAVSTSAHFSLELAALACVGGLLAWAIQSRRALSAASLVVLAAGLSIHAGGFVGAAGAATTIDWVIAGACATAALSARPSEAVLWAAGWTIALAARVYLALHHEPVASSLPAASVLAHAASAAGFLVLAVWATRRSSRSLRLRVVGAFLVVLFVGQAVAAIPLTRVVGTRVRDEALREATVQARAQQTLFARTNEDVLNRAPVVAQTVSAAIAGRANVSAALLTLLDRVFTDLGYAAAFARDRTPVGSARLDANESVVISGSEAISQALRGEPAPSIERVRGAVLALGAAPVFAVGRPQTAENIQGAIAIGRRLDGDALKTISDSSGLAAALVSPSRGEVIASSDSRLERVFTPASARRRLASGRVWTGELESRGRRYLASAAPLARADGTTPAALVMGSDDSVVARTTTSVSRALFASVLAAALIGVVIAVWLGARISRPIIDLTGVARRVEGSLSMQERSGPQEAEADGDEIHQLANAFDSMTNALRSTLGAERETRSRLETILHGMDEGLIAMDDQFRIVSFNPAAETITGITRTDAIGKVCHEVYGNATRGRGGLPICDYMCPLRHGGGRDGSVAWMPKGGREKALAVTCSVLTGPDGEVIGGVDLLGDVTAEVQAEKMKSSFLANISHEMRTPLTPILGYAELMRRSNLPKRQTDEYLSEISGAARRLERIVEILVDVAALEAGRLQITPAPVSPGTLVKDVVERFQDRSDKHRIVCRTPAGLPDVSADGALVGRALDELVDNAIKFSPEGGTVQVSAERRPRGVRISVTDHGIGIDPRERKALFEQFVQADSTETRRFGGLGVGLAFVRMVVSELGGRLAVASDPGQGSTFSIELPRAPRRAASASAR
jgi:two-component system sensor histidine kinase VicK